MQTRIPAASAWQQLKNRTIDCETALQLLVNEQGEVNFDLLDAEVSHRFFREFSHRAKLPPVIPLLLWRSCFYLGSPITFSAEQIKKFSDRTFTGIKIIPVSAIAHRCSLG